MGAADLPPIEERLRDAVDLASGAVETTPVRRSLTPSARAKALAKVGIRVRPPIFGAPTHRLTARNPYQASPEAWLDAFGGDYSSGPAPDSDQIWWRLPATFETEFMAGVNFNFMDYPAEPAVLSLHFDAYPYQGLTGTVVIDIGALRTEIPISVTVSRTVEIGFVHDGQNPVDARVFWRPGLIDFVFQSVSLGGGLIVLDPGPRI